MGAAELAQTIRRRFPKADDDLEGDLAACEEASWGETIDRGAALKLIQKLACAPRTTSRCGQARSACKRILKTFIPISRKGLYERGK